MNTRSGKKYIPWNVVKNLALYKENRWRIFIPITWSTMASSHPKLQEVTGYAPTYSGYVLLTKELDSILIKAGMETVEGYVIAYHAGVVRSQLAATWAVYLVLCCYRDVNDYCYLTGSILGDGHSARILTPFKELPPYLEKDLVRSLQYCKRYPELSEAVKSAVLLGSTFKNIMDLIAAHKFSQPGSLDELD